MLFSGALNSSTDIKLFGLCDVVVLLYPKGRQVKNDTAGSMQIMS